MKAFPDCIPCLLFQALDAPRMAADDAYGSKGCISSSLRVNQL